VIHTLRISHPAFFGIHTAETIRFYAEILGMRIVLRQPNLDDASMEHVCFHVGQDNFIAYFLPYDEAAAAGKYERMKTGYGESPGNRCRYDELRRGAGTVTCGRHRGSRAHRSRLRTVDVLPRSVHLNGQVAAALMANAAELLAHPPNIEKVGVLADKLPG
jgi:catechol 2,3-dioxygenase-like lactoylglutathione lyase family enzyme